MKFLLKSPRKTLFAKMLLTLTITVTVLIIGLSSLLYRNFFTTSLDNINRMNTSILSQTSYSMKYLDTMVSKFTNTVIMSPNTSILLYNQENDMYTLGEALRNLDNLTLPHDYVYSVYTINLALNRITSTETGNFYTKENFYDQDIVNLLQTMNKDTFTEMPIPRKISKTQAFTASEATNVYTYIMPDNPDTNPSSRTATVINVKASVLRDLIASLNAKMADSSNEIIVIDSKGTIVNHTSENLFLHSVGQEPYIQTLLAANQNSGSFKTKLGGQDYQVTYVSSDKPKWKFISLTSYTSFIGKVDTIKTSTIWICLIILGLGLFFSFFISRSLYIPVGKLVKTVKEHVATAHPKDHQANDIYFLQDVFKEMITKNNEWETKQREQIAPLKNKWLQDLLLGIRYVDQKEMKARQKELDIHLNMNGQLRLLLLRLDNYRFFLNQYDEKDRWLLKFGITNIVNEIVSEIYKLETIYLENDQLMLLLEINPSEKAETTEATLKKLIEITQNAVKQYLKLSFSATLSIPVDSYLQLNESYSDTSALSSYRIIAGHGSILTPAFRSTINETLISFPESKAKILLDSLKLGHLDKAKEAYDEFISLLTGTTYENLLSSIMQLSFMLRTTFNTILENHEFQKSDQFKLASRNIEQFETIEEIHEAFSSIFTEIIRVMEQNKNSKHNSIITRITQIVEEQYRDKNLNLRLIADEFQMSNVYLGKLFKEATGKSVSEYITDVRMNHIKHLLDNSNLSTKQILEQCGLEETNYFYTIFKKRHGVSLSQYKLEKNKP
ncbi:helix-turn-helix domain-containing protein [Paenibacillus aceris]|uniref:YesN/AraC family two-component response regulator n=1 Tax=Paenibacillus aceris TaxID=869555 RepID=A0ABS4I371_9BACL|nr:helix-turn-helix domain-containing protein [Paenibacillus aceris]MBP1965342.1 YesN/AraC family two-component response regulator [Paenibacillus aceris]NHW36022.1 helix-turn-helix domain-containing protein [Paenibacillus aceris]